MMQYILFRIRLAYKTITEYSFFFIKTNKSFTVRFFIIHSLPSLVKKNLYQIQLHQELLGILSMNQ